MNLAGSAGQQKRDHIFDASGTITAGGTAQLLLPEHKSRSFLFIQNLSSVDMYIEFGSARATAAITSGKVTSFSVTNAGFGFSVPPDIELLGGGNSGNTAYLGCGQPDYPAPGDAAYVWPRTMDMSSQKPAAVHAVMTGSAPNLSLSSIAIEDPGSGYNAAPFVMISNSLRDPFGCAIPSVGVGMYLPAGGSNTWVNGTFCPTDSVAIFCATTSSAFCCKWAR